MFIFFQRVKGANIALFLFNRKVLKKIKNIYKEFRYKRDFLYHYLTLFNKLENIHTIDSRFEN